MFEHTHRITTYMATAVAVLVLAGPLAEEGRGNFILWKDEQLYVNKHHDRGDLYDTSQLTIGGGGIVGTLYVNNFGVVNMPYQSANPPSGAVGHLYTYDSSTVNISGGYYNVNYHYAYDSSALVVSGRYCDVNGLSVYNFSTVDISGFRCDTEGFYIRDSGTVNISGEGCNVFDIRAYDSSTVNISGSNCDVEYISAFGLSTVNIYGEGCNVGDINAWNFSTVILRAQDFRLGGGLTFYADGVRVRGNGQLSCKHTDGTYWVVDIFQEPNATILAIVPEPATLSLLALGGLALIRRNMKI